MSAESLKAVAAQKHAGKLESPRSGTLRILHVINGLGLGGAETLLFTLATRDRLHSHVVVSIRGPDWYSSRLREQGIEVHHLNMDSARKIAKGVLRLNRIIRESGAHVVQCWMYRSNVVGGLVAKAARKPVVWGVHCSSLNWLRPSSRALARLSGFLARWTPDFIINCSIRSAAMHDQLGFAAAPRTVVHNGYDSTKFIPNEASRCATREALGIASKEFVIGTIARWHPQKDLPNLLEAVRLARDRGLLFRCLLVGTGLDSTNCELAAAIRRLRCGEFVTPLGPTSNVEGIARALDVHILASCDEAFPNAVSETMLSGTPNVATNVGDVGLILGGSGWLAPPRDAIGLADAIVEAHGEWKDRPAEWQARRAAARCQIVKNFSYDRMAKGYRDVWERVAIR